MTLMWPKGLRHGACGHGQSIGTGTLVCALAWGWALTWALTWAWHGNVRGQNGGRPPCGRALVWCAYTKGRAFGDSAFCEQPMGAT